MGEEDTSAEYEEVQISEQLYDELTIQAKKLGCTEEEVLEAVIIWLLESAKGSTAEGKESPFR